jgi:hypothetical protein
VADAPPAARLLTYGALGLPMMPEYSSFSMSTTTTLEKRGMPGFGGAGTGGGTGVGARTGCAVERGGSGADVTVLLGVVGAAVLVVPIGRPTADDDAL